ncbi:GyrI-like domain-containing protein [Candidatus Enterococcus willemsii]|uniref:Transcriptional regulator n=1 Tax=Candidatus Enterococcus willemsii TaxID=1857215 RepID=A0ABQ6YX96_9ENTE|nr:GyrI-like domain-containing protein [Enterococcus sp. CU12B]KAF1301960.1 transcriptional regulator [Enterococcus sp. CU12B]
MKKIDFKKEYKQYYLPKNKPEIIKIPSMNFLAIRGAGDPNEPDGMYAQAISKLYAILYTIKMKGKHLEGYYEYVVPPLEGFWWMDGLKGVDYNHKEKFRWISVIRLPDFVSKTDVEWAISLATETKKNDYSAVMNDFLKEQGYEPDFEPRMHHEIYISDPRKTEADKLKTVIRHPVKLTTLK